MYINVEGGWVQGYLWWPEEEHLPNDGDIFLPKAS